MNTTLLAQFRFGQQLWINFRLALVMLVLCGVIYSGVMTKIAELLFPIQAQGSLLMHQGKAVGSALIAQPFISEKYFYGRPSAAAYDPKTASGSNLAPSNSALRDRVGADSQAIQKLEGITARQIPVDLVSASGSGLDPHITPAAALLQIPRVAKARGITEGVVRTLVQQHIEDRQWGLLGQPRVNVLKLNLALDNS